MSSERMVTLCDGRQVPSDSALWRDECKRRHDQAQEVIAMRGVANRGKRNAYIERVRNTEGAEAGRRLTERVKADWPTEKETAKC